MEALVMILLAYGGVGFGIAVCYYLRGMCSSFLTGPRRPPNGMMIFQVEEMVSRCDN
jgi:hypothetical protein